MKKPEAPDMRLAARTTSVAFGVAVVLWLLGRGALSTPPVASWSAFQRWIGERSTAEAAIAAMRATAALAACYLGIATGLTVVAQVASVDHLDRAARWFIPRSLRPLIGIAVGAGVATAAAGMTVPRVATPTHVATAILEAPTDATATMYVITEPVSTTTTTLAPAASAPTTPASVSAPVVAAVPAPRDSAPPTWTIARGEHLWAVAHETLADSWHREPSDAEVTRYWRELIETNRSRLVDPRNPDYVLAGQVFVLPDVERAFGL